VVNRSCLHSASTAQIYNSARIGNIAIKIRYDNSEIVAINIVTTIIVTALNNNNNHDNVYGSVIMAEPLREFTRFIL